MHHTPDADTIRARAYALWQAAGCPDGDADLYWLQAEHELHVMSDGEDTEGEDTEGEDGNGVITAGPQASSLAEPSTRRPALR